MFTVSFVRLGFVAQEEIVWSGDDPSVTAIPQVSRSLDSCSFDRALSFAGKTTSTEYLHQDANQAIERQMNPLNTKCKAREEEVNFDIMGEKTSIRILPTHT